MPFHQPEGVRYYTFDLFEGEKITHAVFTRVGGVSKSQWSSLNVGLTVGDDPECVAENRRLSFQAVGRPLNTLSDSWLTHGVDVVIYDSPRPLEQRYPPKADIILTDKPGVTLFMRYADCVPILLYDPVKQVVGLAHSGWLGTVKMVGAMAVKAMRDKYGCVPSDILGAIGPSIGPDRYEIGEDTAQMVRAAFGDDSDAILPGYNQGVHFDLWQANKITLEKAGLRKIELAGICTAENPQDWFSHRGSKGKTGRFGVLLGLND
jgi:YfiH family protein